MLCVLVLMVFSANASAVAPSAVKTSFSAVREHSIVLEGEVNPGERVTKYHFVYGAVDCSSNPCTSVPVPNATVPSGSVPVPVKKTEVTGLSEAATYHFRLVVENLEGKAESPDKTFKTFAGSPAFGKCPNDFLRLENPMKAFIGYSSANLPDCRAYEQASPVNKNGSNATGTVPWVKASSLGDNVSFLTTSGMDGADGLQAEIPAWLSTKGSNWSTQGLFAPASSGQTVKVLGWLPDFSMAFEYARREGPPKTVALLARDSVDHALTEIVPYHSFEAEPEYVFSGASGDGRTVVFESNEKLTDEAIDGKSNVYVWDSLARTLHLLSQLPEAECTNAPPCAPPAGGFAGAYGWLKDATPLPDSQATREGGGAFGNYNQDLHALADDGRYAYFTAANTGQLYVRVNPTKTESPITAGKCADSALACTLRVSASKKTNGKGAGSTDAAGPRPAAFMAASADGKTVLFTSSEKLTNDANTGPEAEAPPSIYRSDIAGTPSSVKSDFLPNRAAGMAADATHLYWANPSKGSIGRAKLNGDGDATLVEEEFITKEQLEADVKVEVEIEPGKFEPQTQSYAVPRYVAVDGTHIYWTNATDGEDGHGTIGRAKLNEEGAATEPQPEFITGVNNPTGIDVDPTSTFLYWGNAGSKLETRTIGRAKLGSTGAEEITPKFIPINFGPAVAEGIAVNATHIYAAVNEASNTYIFRYAVNGEGGLKGIFDEEHPGLPGARGISLDASHIYWTRGWNETIGRIDLELENPEREFIKDAGQPLGLVADASDIYWSANQEITPNLGNDLYSFNAETGTLKDLTPDPMDKYGAEVKGVLGTSEDGSYVYFVAGAALAQGATPADCGNGGGECNLYLFRADQPLTFIARLSGEVDAFDWLPASTDLFRHRTGRVSADGRTLLFQSQRQLDTYPNKGVAEIYLYRLGEGVACISCSPVEAQPSGPATLGSIGPSFLIPLPTAAVFSRNLSADGNRAFFETPDPLVVGDTNGDAGCPIKGTGRFQFPTCRDVYEWEAAGTGSCESKAQNGGCLYLISTGKSNEASFFGDASTDGKEAFIFTYAKLVGQDRDQIVDLYDASVDGGLTAQNQLPPLECESLQACRPEPTTLPSARTPGSRSVSAPGNSKPKPPDCSKGKRKTHSKGKTHCGAKHKPKGKNRRKNHKRAAKAIGRASR